MVSQKIGCKNKSLVTLNQIHSNEVICFQNKNSVKNKLPGDAMITKLKNIGMGILTADCAPILLFDPKKKNNRLYSFWVEGRLKWNNQKYF